MKAIHILFAVSAVFASQLPVQAEAIRESGGRLAPVAVEVIFSSRGSGIETALKSRIMTQFAADQQAGQVVVIKEHSFGRGGESTVCVEYVDFSEAYQSDLRMQELLHESNGDTSHKRIRSCSENEPNPPPNV